MRREPGAKCREMSEEKLPNDNCRISSRCGNLPSGESNQMCLKKKIYYLGFAIFSFSFFLPALSVFGEPIRGYQSALFLFGSLFKFNGFLNFSFLVFANLATVLTILVFVLQFKLPFKKLIIFQLVAFISAFFWIGYGIVKGKDLSDLHIGYWNWLFGIFLMLIAMFASIRDQKS
jgi:hypothetical protein